MHVDHIIPLAKGGLHHPRNLRIITAKENIEKRDKILGNIPMALYYLHLEYSPDFTLD